MPSNKPYNVFDQPVFDIQPITSPTKTTKTGSSKSKGSSSSTTTDTTRADANSSYINPQIALLHAISDANSSAILSGKPPVTLAEAVALASKDPIITAKYADALNLDVESFKQSLAALQIASSVESQSQQTKFEEDRKALAESAAAAGTAYSGFRNKAQENLTKDEAGIVQSSRSKKQQDLNKMTTAFTSKYGSAALPPSSITTMNPFEAANVTTSGQLSTLTPATEQLSGVSVPGITGTDVLGKRADIEQSAQNSLSALPSVASLVSK